MAQTTDEEAFADDTPLVELLGDSARVRLLSVFVDEREYDLNVSEVARQAGIARQTVYDHIDDLVELGVVENTRDTGNSKRYQFDPDSDVAELLRKLEGTTLQRLLVLEGKYEPAE